MREGVHERLCGTCGDPKYDQEQKNKEDQNQGTKPVHLVGP
jgi:hypothetical protein